MPDKYMSRISYDGDLTTVLTEITTEFGLGSYRSHELIPIGYEDLNLKVEVDYGIYLVKIFAQSRTQADISRYVRIIESVLNAGILHPKMFTHGSGRYIYRPRKTILQLVVMEWLDGSSYWDLGEKPTTQERSELIASAAKINLLPYKPSFTYDSWAINNFGNEYRINSQYLSTSNNSAVSSVLGEFEAIDHQSLPHCLVHGDLISTNVIKTSHGLYFIDFSVANYLPRVQELAVLLCDLLFDASAITNAVALYNEALDEYQKHIKLERIELDVLPTYIRAAHAMHILPASKFMAQGEDTYENRHWLNLGRAGLHTPIN